MCSIKQPHFASPSNSPPTGTIFLFPLVNLIPSINPNLHSSPLYFHPSQSSLTFLTASPSLMLSSVPSLLDTLSATQSTHTLHIYGPANGGGGLICTGRERVIINLPDPRSPLLALFSSPSPVSLLLFPSPCHVLSTLLIFPCFLVPFSYFSLPPLFLPYLPQSSLPYFTLPHPSSPHLNIPVTFSLPSFTLLCDPPLSS